MSISALKLYTTGELPGRRVRLKAVFPCGRNTAEPSGELSVGDVVADAADGDVRLAVAKTGWAPVPGPLTEVRASEHGTRPLPLPGSAPGSRQATEQEDHGE